MARILVVDDDPDVLALVVRRLHAGGHQAVGAPDAGAALRLVEEKGAPDLAVLDVSLPGMDGLALLARLRGEADDPDLPAVFLSGRIETADIEAGRALGARYLTKPFVGSALLNAVEAAL